MSIIKIEIEVTDEELNAIQIFHEMNEEELIDQLKISAQEELKELVLEAEDSLDY